MILIKYNNDDYVEDVDDVASMPAKKILFGKLSSIRDYYLTICQCLSTLSLPSPGWSLPKIMARGN